MRNQIIYIDQLELRKARRRAAMINRLWLYTFGGLLSLLAYLFYAGLTTF